MLPSALRVGLAGSMELKDAFFKPSWVQENGVDSLLVGAATGICNELDTEITDAVRNFLFGPPTAMMMHDLAALNIQRGRDHGIPDYNTVREAYNLSRAGSFAEVTSDSALQAKLATVYTSVDEIDPWVGCLAEDHLPGCAVGELIKEILLDQFRRLRDCDGFWWETDKTLTAADRSMVSRCSLGKIIRRNIASEHRSTISNDVFHM
jgi:hypothetical protein